MRIVAILQYWIELLAAVLAGALETWRGRRSLIISGDGEKFVIRRSDAGQSEVIATAIPGTPIAEPVVQLARKSSVLLELSPEKVVSRRITVPGKAQEFLPGIIRNQIDRLSPWQVDEAVYGFSHTTSRNDNAMLDVEITITSRAVIEEVCARVAAIGLTVDRVFVGDGPDARTALWSRVADTAGNGNRQMRRLIGAAVACCAGLAVAVSVWALASAASLSSAGEEAATQAKILERKLHASHGTPVSGSLDPAESAWFAKQATPSIVALLEALSRALPNTAYLTELQVDRGRLRISGLAVDAPSLIAPLEQSHHLTNVHFFAPTTRISDGRLYQFHIEAQVEPLLNFAAD
jgi:general secretion pathway protein L